MYFLSLKIENCWYNYLNVLLNNMYIENLYFNIPFSEIYAPVEQNSNIFDRLQYTGNEFIKVINKYVEYYSVLAEIYVFTDNSDHNNIKSVDDLIESGCQLYIGIIDCEEIMICCRNKNMFRTIFDNCSNDSKFIEINVKSYEECKNWILS